MADHVLFPAGEIVAVTGEERGPEVWPCGPRPEVQADEVAYRQVEAGMAEVDQPDRAGLVDHPVTRLEVQVAWHSRREVVCGEGIQVSADDRPVAIGQQVFRFLDPLVRAIGQPVAVSGKRVRLCSSMEGAEQRTRLAVNADGA